MYDARRLGDSRENGHFCSAEFQRIWFLFAPALYRAARWQSVGKKMPLLGIHPHLGLSDRHGISACDESLTAAERTFLVLVAGGKTSQQIGSAMNASGRMMDSYRRAIAEKLKLRSVAEMVQYVHRQKLREIPAQPIERRPIEVPQVAHASEDKALIGSAA